MCEHPAHQVNVSRIGVLCVPDSMQMETCLQWWLRSLQLEETEQLITMPVKLPML